MNSYVVDVAALKARLAKAAAESWGMPSQSDYDAWQRWQGADTAKPERKRQHWPRHRAPDDLLTMQEAAARLGCSTKTLKDHIAAGEIGYVALGHGTKRTRKMFAPADLDTFIANQRRKESPACLSDATRARPTGNTTFRSEVIAFSARPSARIGARRKR